MELSQHCNEVKGHRREKRSDWQKKSIEWLHKIHIFKKYIYSQDMQDALQKTLEWTRCVSTSEAESKGSQIIEESQK